MITDVKYTEWRNFKERYFELTPRRKEILLHIAYNYEVKAIMRPSYGRGKHWDHEKILTFFLDGKNIHQIVALLRSAKLVKFEHYLPGGDLRITPLGMQVLLQTVRP